MKGAGDRATDSTRASVQTRSLGIAGVLVIVVLAGLVIVGLATRHRSPLSSASSALPPASPGAAPTQDAPRSVAAAHTFDAHGVFFRYPASSRPVPPPLGAGLVPAGSSWSAVFRDDAGDLIRVAAYPSGDPGTTTARFERADEIAREMAPSASAERTAIQVRATYPSFGYPLDSLHPSGVGFVVFSPHAQFAIGCSAAAAVPSGETRCRFVLDSFRDTSAGVSLTTPTVRSAAESVYQAWKSGEPSEAGAVATQGVLRYLVGFPWTPQSALGSCDTVPGSSDTFACTVNQAGTAGELLVVTPMRGHFTVVAIGECSGDVTHGSCYTLRTRAGSFP